MIRRRSFRPHYPTTAVAIIALALVALRVWQERTDAPAPDVLAEGEYRLGRVVDGDTLLLANKARVRLIGVNTPETVKPDHPVEPWGPEASEFTKQFLAHGPLRLQFDQERKDRYGRFLAYVWVTDPANGQRQMLNEELIRAGLGRATLRFHYSETMKRRFSRAQDEARRARRGIWSDPNVSPPSDAPLPEPAFEGA